jgi:putative ABC transport system permease protein
MTSSPPRLALWLLQRRLPDREVEFVLGDLEECFQEITERESASTAQRWYWTQTLSMVFRTWPNSVGKPSHSPDGSLLGLRRDVRYGFRVLRRAPAFSSLVVLTFAIGIGSTAAIFSVLDPVLLRGAPYPSADRLVMVWGQGKDGTETNVGFLTFRDIARETHALSSAAAISQWTPIIRGNEDSERLAGQRVTYRYFATLGIKPALGRDFRAEEDHSATRTVVILSHGLWQRRFGGDSSILGRTIRLSDRSYTVIGVMPERYENLLAPLTQLWAPLGYEDADPWACRSCQHLRMIARLRDGVSRQAASAELQGISTEMVRANPDQYSAVGLLLTPLNQYLTRNVRPALLATAAAVLLLLVIACVNVTNLFLGRASRRSSEFALRSALGAGTGPLVRQVLIEGVVLALVGGVLGLVLAYGAVAGLVRLAPPGVPRLDQVSVNLGVALFTLVIATAAGLVAGLAPAVSALRASLVTSLRQSARSVIGAASRRVRAGLVVAEVALALVLLACAGLLVRSLERLLAVNPGFDPDNLVTLELDASGSRYDSATVYQFYREVSDRVGALPGVKSVGATTQLPLSGDFDSWGVHVESHPNVNPEEDESGFRFAVTPRYLETMGIPLLRGRSLTEADNAHSPPVVLINQAMARELFPGQDPLGQRVKVGGMEPPWRTIVGIVGDVRHLSLDAGDEFEFYLPTTQNRDVDSRQVLVVRGERDPKALLPSILRAIREVDPGVPVATIATMAEYIRTRSAIQRFALEVFQVFAGVALLLATLGLYGVLAGNVTERTREIGIRSALGAPPRRLLGLVLRHAMMLTLIGMAVGLGAALLLTRVLRSLLYEVTPTDPATFAGVGVLLAVVALAAASIPGVRALRIDPAVVLREE